MRPEEGVDLLADDLIDLVQSDRIPTPDNQVENGAIPRRQDLFKRREPCIDCGFGFNSMDELRIRHETPPETEREEPRRRAR